jgi:Family of unknown function (DUF6920)
MLTLVLGLLAGLLLILSGAAAWGKRRWGRRTRKLVARVNAHRLPATTVLVNLRAIDSLPAPVQRYLRTVLQDGTPMIAAVDIEHAGQFNLGEDSERWRPFTSRQRVMTRRPGFVWDGRIAMLPGLPVHVHDAYVAGEGILHASLLGLISLFSIRGTPEVAEGELMRFLAEAACYPTILLPGQGVHWEAVDARSARATLSDGAITVALLFSFDDNGLVATVTATARGRTVGGQVVPTPWEGRWSDYQWRDGMRVPTTGEVAWLLPQGRKPYWRGRITRIVYEFAA